MAPSRSVLAQESLSVRGTVNSSPGRNDRFANHSFQPPRARALSRVSHVSPDGSQAAGAAIVHAATYAGGIRPPRPGARRGRPDEITSTTPTTPLSSLRRYCAARKVACQLFVKLLDDIPKRTVGLKDPNLRGRHTVLGGLRICGQPSRRRSRYFLVFRETARSCIPSGTPAPQDLTFRAGGGCDSRRSPVTDQTEALLARRGGYLGAFLAAHEVGRLAAALRRNRRYLLDRMSL